MSFLGTMGIILMASMVSLVILSAIIYFGWVGFIGTLLVFCGPGVFVLYRREKRSLGVEIDDKIGSDRMGKALDELAERKKNEN